MQLLRFSFRKCLSAIVAFALSLGLVNGVIAPAAKAALPTLNDNTDVFQISFTGVTSMTSFSNQTLVSPNNLQVQWSLNPTYNATTKNYDVGTNWITISSTVTPLTTVRIPTSGSGPSGAVTALSPIVSSDLIVMTIRADPQNLATASLGGYIGQQATAVGTKPAATIGDHTPSSGNPFAKELISFGNFAGFAILQDAFSRVPSTFSISAKLPTTVTDLSYSFGQGTVAQNYNKPDIAAWDTTNVTNMSNMFRYNRVFNQDISGWNTSNVTTMAGMFYDDIVFDQPIGSWSVSNVTDMSAMFKNANMFNQPLSSWNTSKVTNMNNMFYAAIRFNQNLSTWNVASVTDMNNMFYAANAFNGDISTWNTGSVTNLVAMFNLATSFNQPIGNWNVSNVTNTISMFSGASAFNQNLNSWNVSKITNMTNMFQNATNFNNGLASGVNGDFTWTMSNTVTDFTSMFQGATAFNQNLSSWNTSAATTFYLMFNNASKFNGTVNSWNTANVTAMKQMFKGAAAFNQPVSNWNVSKVVNFTEMFYNTNAANPYSFNQSLDSWSFAGGTIDMSYMFYNANRFNNGYAVGTSGSMTWTNLKTVTTMSNMFYGATAFNQNLNSWVMDRMGSYINMFYGATSFNNGNAAAMTWNLVGGGVPLSASAAPATDMTSMFQGATAFNQNLNSWNVSFVSNMKDMFRGATSFNNGLGSGVSGSMTWKMASGVTDFSGMFQEASSFNQSMSTWVTTRVSKFFNMLTGATSFNQSLASFNIALWQNSTGISFPASMSSENVQDTLKSWAWQPRPSTMGINLDAGQTAYSDCPSYNAFLQFTGGSAINTGIRPAAPTCTNTANITWSPSTTNTSPTVVNGINQTSSNTYTFTPSAAPTGGNAYIYASRSDNCQVNPTTGVILYRGNTSTCTIRVLDPTVTGAGTTAGSYVDVSFTLTSYTNPALVTGITGTVVDSTTVRTSWTAPATTGGTEIVSYKTYYAVSPTSSYTEGCTVSAPSTTCDVTGLTTGTSYTFRTYAWNGARYSADPTASSVVTPDVAPGAPTITSIDPSGTGNQLVIGYTAGTNNGSAITGYEYTTDNGATWKAVPGSTASTLTIIQESGSTATLTFGVTYTVKVRAKNTISGAESNAMTGSPEIKKNAPTVTGITGSFTQLSVAFTAPTLPAGGNAISTYEYSTDGGTTWKQRESGTTASPLVITTVSSGTAVLTSATTYAVQLRAKNLLSGFSSPTTNGTTDIAPGAPTLGAITGGYLQLSVSFTPGTNSGTALTKYQYSTDSGTTWSDFAGLTSPQVITTRSDTGAALSNKTSYSVKIRAFNSMPGTQSSTVTGTTTDPLPGAPTSLVATPGNAQISVAFTTGTNTGSPITKYQYSFDGTTWADATGTSSPVTISGLINGTTYAVRLRAFNSAAGSASSAATGVIPNVSLSAPTSVSATLSGYAATISWTAPSGNVSSYAVTADTGSYTCTTFSVTYSPATSCTISNLAPGTTYTFTVTATNNIGTSQASNPSNSVTTASIPNSPTNVGAALSGNSATISWTDGGGAPAQSYTATSNPSGFNCSISAPSASCDVTGLTYGTPYTWTVVATNGVGTSSPSSPSTAVTPEVAPGAPTISSITAGNAQLSVAFTAGSNTGSSITKYQYSTDDSNWVDASGSASPIIITTQSSAGTPALNNGVSYNIRIRAVNTVSGTASSAVSGTPEVTPGAPTINVTPGDKQFSIAFTSGSNSGSSIVKYQYTTDGGTNWRDLTGLSGPFVVNRTSTNALLVNGQSYQVGLRAVNTTNGVNSSYTSVAPDVAPPKPITYWIMSDSQTVIFSWGPGTPNLGSAVTKYQYTTDQGATWKDLVELPTSRVTTVLTSTSDNLAFVNGNAYTVQVRAINTMPSIISQGVTGPVDVILMAPTISGIEPGDRQLTVSFAPPAATGGTAITRYFYSTDGGVSWLPAGSTLTSPIVLTTTSTGAALVNGTTYNVQLKAKNSQLGQATPSTAASPNIAPGAPTINSITTSDRQLSVVFTEGTNTGSAVTKYQYSTDGGSTWRDRSAGTIASPIVIATTSSSNSNLVNGTSYSIKIRAFNTMGGTESTDVSATPNVIPGPVTNLFGTSGDAQVPLTWTAPSGSTVTDYVIEYSSNGVTYSTFSDSVGSTPSVTVTGLTNGTAYTFRVTSLNGTSVGESTTSSSITPRANQAALNWGTFSTSVAYQGTLTLSTTGGSGSGAVIYSASAQSTCSIASNILTPGDAGSTCVITATKISDGAFNPISTTALTITVTRIAQATNLTFTNANSVMYGNSLTVKAVGGSGSGTIAYSVSSAGTTGCSINSTTGVLSVSAAGTCRVAAERAASTNFVASNSATQDITVTKASQSISFSSTIPSNPIAGDTYTVTGSSSAGLTVSFAVTSGLCSINGSTVTFNGSGSCVIKGTQAGSGQYLAANDIAQTIVVGQRNQVLRYTNTTLDISSVLFGSPAFPMEATSSESNAIIIYSLGSSTTNSACTVSSSGLVSIDAVGVCQIQADSASTSAYAAASAIVHSFNVVPAPASSPFVTSIGSGNASITLNFTPPSNTGGSSISAYQIVAIPQSGSGPTVSESGCLTTTVNGEATCTIRGLSNGVNYKVQVAAITAAGVGNYSALSNSLLVYTNPSAVQSLRVTQLNAQLIINWTDPDSLGGGTFSEYRIFIKRSVDANYNQTEYFAITDGTLHQFTANKVSPTGVNLLNGTAYDIKVVTVTTANSSELTANTAVVNQIPRTVPDAPVFEDALILGSDLVLTWQAPTNDGGSPIVSYDAILGSQTCNFVSATDTFCTLPAPAIGGTYNYQVRALNAAGSSDAASGSVQIGMTPTTSAAPETSLTNIAPSSKSTSSVVVTRKSTKPTKRTSPEPTLVPTSAPSSVGESEKPQAQQISSATGSGYGVYSLYLFALLSIAFALYLVLVWRRRKKLPNN